MDGAPIADAMVFNFKHQVLDDCDYYDRPHGQTLYERIPQRGLLQPERSVR